MCSFDFSTALPLKVSEYTKGGKSQAIVVAIFLRKISLINFTTKLRNGEVSRYRKFCHLGQFRKVGKVKIIISKK